MESMMFDNSKIRFTWPLLTTRLLKK